MARESRPRPFTKVKWDLLPFGPLLRRCQSCGTALYGVTVVCIDCKVRAFYPYGKEACEHMTSSRSVKAGHAC